MSIKITQEEFIKRVTTKFDNVDVLGEYISAKTPVKFRCKIHDYEFGRTPDHMKKAAYGCPKCGRERSDLKRRRTNEDFVSLLKTINPNVIPLEAYKTALEKISVQCAKCGHIWRSCPDSLLRSNGCKKCAMKYVQNLRIKSHEQFIKDVESNNPAYKLFEVTSIYVKDIEPVECRCKVCNRYWTVIAHNICSKGSNTGCPYCSISKGELKILTYLENSGLNFQWHKEFDGLLGLGGGSLSYDFYIPDSNLLIEYQGQFHDGTVVYQTNDQFLYQQEHDRRKRQYALDNKITLLEIWYKDFDNIETILDKELHRS